MASIGTILGGAAAVLVVGGVGAKLVTRAMRPSGGAAQEAGSDAVKRALGIHTSTPIGSQPTTPSATPQQQAAAARSAQAFGGFLGKMLDGTLPRTNSSSGGARGLLGSALRAVGGPEGVVRIGKSLISK
jgi:hypothetical protein